MEIKDIEKLATLARIALDEEEKKALLKDTEEILKFVEQVREVETKDEAEERVGMVHNVMREDSEPHETGIHTDALLDEAPARKDNYVHVKKIL